MNSSRPLRIAVYARYSSDLQNPTSIDDQVTVCRHMIGDHFRGRADPTEAFVFSDSAISGSTMQRPGLMRLLRGVRERRVDVVVAEGLDRLSRNLKDIAAIYETLDYHGVSVWTVHEGGRVNELHIGLKGTMNALVLRDLKARIKRGHRSRIAAGYAASSCAYGYRVVRGVVDAKGANVNGLREIDETAAKVIRRIYDEYISGRKISEIVAGLNAEGVPAPNGGLWKRNSIMGGAKKQEGILRNEIYLGKLIFNRSHVVRDPISNKKRFVLNPEAEWTKVDVPHLRIIRDEQWAAVRLLDQAKPKAPKQKLSPTMNTHNQHALTGWVKCGWCGGSKSLANETRYLCSTHRYAKSCANSRGTKEAVLLRDAFAALYQRIEEGADFAPGIERYFVRETERKAALEEQENDLKARIARLLDAVESGVGRENVTERILELQDGLEKVRFELAGNQSAILESEAVIRANLMRAIQSIERSDDVPTKRLMFQCLLNEIVLTPIPDQPRGETVEIRLREEGWPEFWRMITVTN